MKGRIYMDGQELGWDNETVIELANTWDTLQSSCHINNVDLQLDYEYKKNINL